MQTRIADIVSAATRQKAAHDEVVIRDLLGRWISEVEPTLIYGPDYRLLGLGIGGVLMVKAGEESSRILHPDIGSPLFVEDFRSAARAFTDHATRSSADACAVLEREGIITSQGALSANYGGSDGER